MSAPSSTTSSSNVGVVVGRQGLPVGDGRVPVGAGRAVLATLEVGEGRLVGGDEAGLGAALDRHVADRHAALHREVADDVAAVLDDLADAAAGADAPMIARITSLAVEPSGSTPLTVTAMVPGPGLRQGLGGEHVLDLARADAEGDRTEGAVGGGVGVAAHDGHARLGEALLGPDDVDDALLGVAHREVRDAELGGVAAAACRPGYG